MRQTSGSATLMKPQVNRKVCRAARRELTLREGAAATFAASPPVPTRASKKGQPEVVLPTGLLMSGRLDSNQRPPEPHSLAQGRSQPPNVTNASLLETYRLRR